MKAVEFQSEVTPDQTLAVPAEVAESLPVGRVVRVLVLISEADDEVEWEQTAATDSGQGYAAGDAIYEQLSGR